MGWLWLALIGVAVFAGLWLAGAARGLWTFVASALMLGAAGYAWQQHATLEGHSVAYDSKPIVVPDGMVAFRRAMLRGTPGDDATLSAADDRLRAGDTAAAGQAILDAIARDPGNATLWTGLGTALTLHDGGQVSPAALFAFRRAMSLAPDQPGPVFFYGLAYAQIGDLATAQPAWQRALALTPTDASYRSDLTQQLAIIDQAMASGASAR